MAIMQSIMDFYSAHSASIAAALLAMLAASESMPFIQSIESNGIVQLVINLLKKIAGK